MSNIGNKEILAKNLVFYLRVCGKEQKEVAIRHMLLLFQI